MRNSNLLPVKAKGVVRLRSVASRLRTGTVDTPESSLPEASSWMESALETIWSTTLSSWSPRQMEMMAGGASWPPRRCSLPTQEADCRSRSAWTSTAFMMQERTSRNCRFSLGVSPGSSRFSPVSVPMDQLLCLPEPLTPA